jgi:hypothetical protein
MNFGGLKALYQLTPVFQIVKQAATTENSSTNSLK